MTSIVVDIRVRKWVHWYIRGVAFFCWLFNREPNEKKVLYWVKKDVFVSGTRMG